MFLPRATLLIAAALALVPRSASSQNLGVTVAAVPPQPLVEMRDRQQLVNFDLLLQNPSAEPLKVIALRLSVFDSADRLVLKRELNQNGHPPALDIVGDRLLAPKAVIDLFQPFPRFDPDVPLHRMHIDVLLSRQNHPAPPVPLTSDALVSVDLYPTPAKAAAPFCLPVRGLTLVHDGHDLFSHHRRFDLSRRFAESPDAAVNANLYAYDLMPTNEHGDLYLGDPSIKENWLPYGKPITAPEDGVVVEATGGLRDNAFQGTTILSPPGSDVADPNGLGNHVILRHPDGRVSWLLHMRPGSVTVHSGDHVRRGQQLGEIGFSGDSLFPHLHYNVTATDRYPSQGVPSYFRSFSRMLGASRKTFNDREAGQIDTGDLVESTASCSIAQQR